MNRGFKVALAMGGGGARGFAHIGIIKVLKEHSIPIDLVIGTSMGAIVGATYCLNPDVDILKKKIFHAVDSPQIRQVESLFAFTSEQDQRNLIFKKLLSKIRNICIWNLRAAKRWLVRTEPMVQVFQELYNDKKFSDTQIPFACTAVDLNEGSAVTLQTGRILEAVLASSSIPGVFAPVKLDNQLLADGGVLYSVPARQARLLGADFVIGIDLTTKYSKRELLSGLDVMYQADQIKSYYLNKENLKYCDCVIEPDTFSVSWPEFSRGAFCIQQGEKAALREIDKIKKALIRKKRFYGVKRWFSELKGKREVV